MDAIKFLIEQKANIHIEDFTGKDACDYARFANIKAFPELLNCSDPSLRRQAKANRSSNG